MEMNSIHNAKEDENDNLIPRYNVLKFNFSDEEKFILEELRENLIDLAISEKMSSFNEELILKDIIRKIGCRIDLIMITRKIWQGICLRNLLDMGN